MNHHFFRKTLLLLALCLITHISHAGQWFEDPDNHCAVWGEYEQPIAQVSWSGVCVDGKAHGQGTMIVYIDNIPFSRYEGEYRQGKAHGFGVLISPDESRYEGYFEDNIMHGKGVIISKNGRRLEGNYHQGLPHGLITATEADGSTLEMEFEYGRRIK